MNLQAVAPDADRHQTPAPVSWLDRVPSYVPGKPAHDGGLALAANEAASCSERVATALRSESSWHRYPDPLATRLREDLARYHGVRSEQILVGNGSDELVQLLIAAYVGHGGMVVAADPPYAMSRIVALTVDASFEGVPLVDNAHDLDEMARREADLVYVVNPHNPTGTCHDGAAITRFARRAAARLVVIDEAYIDFATEREPADPAACIADGRTVVLRTFSKAYGLAGCRVGYLIGSEEIIEQLRRVRAPFSVTAPSQAAAAAALADQEFLALHIAEIAEVRAALSERLRELGCKVPDSQANFILLAGVDEHLVVARLAEQGIAVRAGSGLGMPGSVRITVPTRRDLPRLVAALENSLLGLIGRE